MKNFIFVLCTITKNLSYPPPHSSPACEIKNNLKRMMYLKYFKEDMAIIYDGDDDELFLWYG